MVVTLGSDADTIKCSFKLEKGDEIRLHELGAYWSTDCVSKLCSADSDVLLNLNNAHPIFAAFCLNWNHVMRTLSIHTDIHLIGFNLPDTPNTRAQVALE
jgi:hypothetical protein